jgi:class 3 adenylate cyclase/DNA-binding beta-propeller fold protein YncE
LSATALRTFLIADVRGYTRWTQERGDEAASDLAARFAQIVRGTMPGFGGELLELRGDEALCVFGSARQALRAAVELQRRLRTADSDGGVFPLGVGVGLDAGEAVPTEGGYRGGALNLSARLCAIAAPGEMLASEGVTHLAQRVPGIVYGKPRPVRVKGIDEPVRMVEVLPTEPLPPLPVSTASRRARRRPSRLGWAAIAVCAFVAAAGVVWLSVDRTSAGMRVRVNTVAIIDPAGDRVVGDIPVGQAPLAIASGFGAVWVANSGDNTVSRIDLRTKQARTIKLSGSPSAIATGGGYVWAYDTGTGRIFQIDRAGSPEPVGTFHLSACCSLGCAGIAAGYGRLWVSDGGADVYTLDWHTPHPSFRPLPGLPNPALAVTIGNGYVYSADYARVLLIHPTRPPLKGALGNAGATNQNAFPLGITAGGRYLWAVSPTGGSTIRRFDPGLDASSDVPGKQPPGNRAVTTGGGSVWVTNIDNSTLSRIDPANLTITDSISLHAVPTGAVFARGRLWLTAVSSANTPHLNYC